MVGMVVTMLGKVEHDQRVTANFGRIGENRTRRLNWLLLVVDAGQQIAVRYSGFGALNNATLPVTLYGLVGDCQSPRDR